MTKQSSEVTMIKQRPKITPRLSAAERRRKFFYAEDEAWMYDDTIELVVPLYNIMHETMIGLLEYHFDTVRGVKPEDVEGIVLDVGSGTGTESIAIMKKFPNIKIAALDFCAPMHDEFRKNIEKDEVLDTNSALARVEFIPSDLLATDEVNVLREYALKEGYKEGYTAVISALTIHHFDEIDKEKAYSCISEVLEPGGIMINGDLFSYGSDFLTNYAEHYDLSWIAEQFNDPNPEFIKGRAIPKERRAKLSEAWLAHYRYDNKLSSIEVQKGMLVGAGFAEVGNPFRFWQVGILWGRK